MRNKKRHELPYDFQKKIFFSDIIYLYWVFLNFSVVLNNRHADFVGHDFRNKLRKTNTDRSCNLKNKVSYSPLPYRNPDL